MTTRGIGLAIVVGASAMVNAALASDDGKERPCYSITESKIRGCFVCSLSLSQNTFILNGKKAAIRQAWIEKCVVRGPILGMTSKPVSGFQLCLSYAKDCDFHPTFWLEGKGWSFRRLGTVIAHERLDTLAATEYSIVCHLDDKNIVKMRATLDRERKGR